MAPTISKGCSIACFQPLQMKPPSLTVHICNAKNFTINTDLSGVKTKHPKAFYKWFQVRLHSLMFCWKVWCTDGLNLKSKNNEVHRIRSSSQTLYSICLKSPCPHLCCFIIAHLKYMDASLRWCSMLQHCCCSKSSSSWFLCPRPQAS